MNIENPITALLLFTTIAQTSADADEAEEAANQAQDIIDANKFDDEIIASTRAMSNKLIDQHAERFFIEVHLDDGTMALVGCDDQETLQNGLVKFQVEYPGGAFRLVSMRHSHRFGMPSLRNGLSMTTNAKKTTAPRMAFLCEAM